MSKSIGQPTVIISFKKMSKGATNPVISISRKNFCVKCLFDRLVKNADGSFTLTRHSGRIYQFNAQGGRLLEISNKKGQSLGRDAMPRVSTSVICFDARHLETRGIASLHRIIENCGKGCPFISRKVAKPLSF